MSADAAIVERWVERTLKSYPAEMLSFLSGEQDPFSNPVGHTLRENLATLVHELLGTMDKERIASALDGLVRMRAVQNFSPAAALHFVFDLRSVIGEVSGAVSEPLQGRIDELALMAFDQYMACRERIFELRVNELRLWARGAAAGEGGTP
ncbi:MAG TPA: RsbRD N-terminal domain-containing protein [Terracidiphilus sp.]|nr:RsbRD N-terminal domain-containing protein [Terracidiphilus sp.]